MAFTQLTADVENHTVQVDEPNDVGGLTAEQFKILCDKAAVDIKTFINAHLVELASVSDGDSGADNIGITAISALGASATVQSIIEAFVTKIQSTSADASGAEFTGAETISGLTGNDVQTLLEALNTIKAPLASPTFTGTPTAPSGTDYTTARIRNAIFSTVDPLVGDGENGEVWYKYIP